MLSMFIPVPDLHALGECDTGGKLPAGMSDTHFNFQQCVSVAVRRLRLQRLVRFAGLTLSLAPIFLCVALATLWLFPRAGSWVALSCIVAGALWVVCLLLAWVLPVEKGLAVRAIDARFGLADHALTASELNAKDGPGWLGLQYGDTMFRLRNVNWRTAWPLRWPKFSAPLAGAAIVLAALVGVRLAWIKPSPPAETTGLQEEAAAIEEMFEDWEKAAELSADVELREFVAELQPLRWQLREMDERGLLLALSTVENRLEALRDAAARDSLDAAAGDMANAFERVEGMSALAATLRRKDFKKASELSAKEAEELAKAGAEIPRGADSAEARQQMAQAARRLEKSGQSGAAAAMNEVRQGAEKRDAAALGRGMGQLAQSFGRGARRQAAQARLGLQLAQVEEAKSEVGRGEGMGFSLLPKLSQQTGGKGAGSESDPNRFKDPTQIESARSRETLSGTAGEGESETERLVSDAPGAEAPRADRAAQFARYEKLSQQAIADEDLPLRYRETIRKYFEAIRPAEK
jgi:hypothetical protein